MVEVTTSEAARRLGVSQERVGQMLRSGELAGRRLSARSWLVELGSVSDRGRTVMAGGRPWSPGRIRTVLAALSENTSADSRTRSLIHATEPEMLWRRVEQGIAVRRFRVRGAGAGAPMPARVHGDLALTGESALERLGERLVAGASGMHGYLRVPLDEMLDSGTLIEDAEGEVHVYGFKDGAAPWGDGGPPEDRAVGEIPRALVAADCARSPATRVHAAGVRALGEMRSRWLAQNS